MFSVGDVVVAVPRKFTTCEGHRTGRSTAGSSGVIEVGRCYTISAVNRGDYGPCGNVALVFVEAKPSITPDGFCPGCFRKVKPASKSFTEMVRKMKPLKVGEPA